MFEVCVSYSSIFLKFNFIHHRAFGVLCLAYIHNSWSFIVLCFVNKVYTRTSVLVFFFKITATYLFHLVNFFHFRFARMGLKVHHLCDMCVCRLRARSLRII